MKKLSLFIIFCSMLSAVTSSAQVTRWYSYADYSYNQSLAYGEDGGYFPLVLWNDTTAQYGNTSTGSPIYYHTNIISAGMSFAPRLSDWNDASVYGASIKVGPTDVYVIDSVRLYGIYLRDNTKTAPKDTIKLSFVYGDGTTGTNITSAGLVGGHYGSINFIDLTHDSVKNIAGKSLSGPAPYTQNIILSNTDTASTFIKAYKLTTAFSVPAGKCAGMSMTFRSGDASYFPNDTIVYASGKYKHGEFSPFVQYNASSLGGPVDWAIYNPADSNVGFFKDVLGSIYGWAGIYVPTYAWSSRGGPSSLQYPMIDFHITCPTCDLNDTITGTTNICVGATSPLAVNYTGGTWSSSNTSIATVTSGGVAKGIAVGTATITYMLSGHKTTTTVYIQDTPAPTAVIGSSSLCTGGSSPYSDVTSGGTWSSTFPGIASISSGGLVFPLSSGVTNIVYTITDICGSKSASKSVTVTALPTVSPILGPSTVCVGNTITLSDATSGGSWVATGGATVSSAGIVTGVAVGVASISYGVSNSCGIAATGVNVTVETLPDAGTISGANTVCIGATIVMSDNVSGGTWSSILAHSTVVGNTVVGVTAGVDTIAYTVSNTCGTSITRYVVTVNDCVSEVRTVPFVQDINIHPNPTPDNIMISSSSAIRSVVVSNMVGQAILSETYNANSIELSLSQLPSGVYMVRVNNNNVYKVVKQ